MSILSCRDCNRASFKARLALLWGQYASALALMILGVRRGLEGGLSSESREDVGRNGLNERETRLLEGRWGEAERESSEI